MNNLEAVIATLFRHREARGWTDEAVAADVLAQLGLDPAGEATHATPAVDPNLITEDEVVAAETAAQEAVDKAKAARAALEAQTAPKADEFVPADLPGDEATGEDSTGDDGSDQAGGRRGRRSR
jgi:hypothetical protein